MLEVARCGSFSGAALELNLSQSTVSHAVSAVETELGLQVFVRGRHGATLTSPGQEVLRHARHALHALEAMAVCAASGAHQGELHLASCRSVLRHFITPALDTWRQYFPDIALRLHDFTGEHDDIECAVLRGDAQVGLGRLPMHPSLVSVPLLQDEYLVVTARHQSASSTWADLQRLPYILCDEDCAGLIAEHMARHAQPPRYSARFRDIGTVLDLVAAGEGYTILTRLAAPQDSGSFQTSPLPTPLWRSIGLVTTTANAAHPWLQHLRRTLLSEEALRARSRGLGPSVRIE
ncbi:LysR family transcriptional regulator [Deinococcus cavernae]|nr:LysR family transcriptional regulator [Deinococcus cavernae]